MMMFLTGQSQVSSRLNVALVAILLVSAITASACNGYRESDPADARAMSPTTPMEALSPLKVAVLQDQTASASWTRTPQLSRDHFERFRSVFHRSGGEIAFGLIRDKSNRGLVRKRFSPPILEPKLFARSGDIFDDAESEDSDLLKRKKWEEDCKHRDDEIDRLFDEFLAEIKPLLDMVADAERSDVWGAVQRGDLFLGENDTAWKQETHRYLLLLTDGEDNVSRNRVAMQSGASVLLVNGAASIGSLASLKPGRFESAEAAIGQICALEGGK